MNSRPIDGPSTLPAVWDHLYRRRVPELVAQHSTVGGETYTYKELNAKAHCLAAYLISKGVEPAEPVAILSANIGSYLAMDLAVQYAGALNVTISQDFSSAQLVRILHQTHPRFVLITSYALYERHRGVLDTYVAESGAELLCRTASGVELTEQDRITMMENAVEIGKVFWRENGAAVRAPREAADPHDACTILYDRLDGTDPKGAVLSHHNFLAAARTVDTLLHPAEGDVVLNLLSPAYAMGRLLGLYFPLLSGTQLVQVHNLGALLPAIQQYKPAYVTATPALLRALRRTLEARFNARGWWARRNLRLALDAANQVLALQAQGQEPKGYLRARHRYALGAVWRKLQADYLPGVRYFLSDGRGLTPSLVQFFELTGTPILTGFGLKETAGLLSMTDPQQRRPGTVGAVVPGTKIRLRIGNELVEPLTADGSPVGPGMLDVSGDVVMLGYWNGKVPKAKQRTLWHDTGMTVRVDRGHLQIES